MTQRGVSSSKSVWKIVSYTGDSGNRESLATLPSVTCSWLQGSARLYWTMMISPLGPCPEMASPANSRTSTPNGTAPNRTTSSTAPSSTPTLLAPMPHPRVRVVKLPWAEPSTDLPPLFEALRLLPGLKAAARRPWHQQNWPSDGTRFHGKWGARPVQRGLQASQADPVPSGSGRKGLPQGSQIHDVSTICSAGASWTWGRPPKK